MKESRQKKREVNDFPFSFKDFRFSFLTASLSRKHLLTLRSESVWDGLTVQPTNSPGKVSSGSDSWRLCTVEGQICSCRLFLLTFLLTRPTHSCRKWDQNISLDGDCKGDAKGTRLKIRRMREIKPILLKGPNQQPRNAIQTSKHMIWLSVTRPSKMGIYHRDQFEKIWTRIKEKKKEITIFWNPDDRQAVAFFYIGLRTFGTQAACKIYRRWYVGCFSSMLDNI